MRRGLSSLFGSLAAIALVVACVSPTLPLPPPLTPDIAESKERGKVELSSTRGAQPNAVVVIVNQDLTLDEDARVDGTLADSEGTWRAVVQAKPGDTLDIHQESGDQRSAPVTLKVPTNLVPAR